MNFLTPLYAALAVVAIGLLTAWLASKVVGAEKGHVAGFALTVGILIGNSAAIERSATEWWLDALGVVIGLALLWRFLFRRALSHG